MTEKKNKRLPENWKEMAFGAKCMWFEDNFLTYEEDEEGKGIYDTENMSEEVREAYEEIQKMYKYKEEMFKQGYMIDFY